MVVGSQYKDVPPKPVTYDNCNFRSTLEARWAVMFNQLDLEWDYEPDRFEFDDGLVYIPDFRLMNSRPVYVEIKPAVIDSIAFVKASKLARTQQCLVFMCIGDFWDGYEIWRFDISGVLDFDYMFKRCKKCGRIYLDKKINEACSQCGESMRLSSLGLDLVPKGFKFQKKG